MTVMRMQHVLILMEALLAHAYQATLEIVLPVQVSCDDHCLCPTYIIIVCVQCIVLLLSCHSYTDVNECEVGLDNCNENAACSNTERSFTCSCLPGYIGDGRSCTGKELDEYIITVCG